MNLAGPRLIEPGCDVRGGIHRRSTKSSRRSARRVMSSSRHLDAGLDQQLPSDGRLRTLISAERVQRDACQPLKSRLAKCNWTRAGRVPVS